MSPGHVAAPDASKRVKPEADACGSEAISALQDRLGVRLNSADLLVVATTHRSYLGETSGNESNERFEFLGDAILGLVVAEYLFREHRAWTEGELSRAKAVAVSEPTLANAARKLSLQDAMRLSTGERQSGGYERASILSDMFEAIVGVIYVDRGLEEARGFVIRALGDVLSSVGDGDSSQDHKSRLQQMVQGRYKTTPRYASVQETGADHDKTFTIEVTVEGEVMGRGEGKSKKQAEQMAAAAALDAYADCERAPGARGEGASDAASE